MGKEKKLIFHLGLCIDVRKFGLESKDKKMEEFANISSEMSIRKRCNLIL